MALEPTMITLLDLDNADIQDITRVLDSEDSSLRPERLLDSRYGEPTTILLAVIVASPVIRALAAWLLKRRRKGKVELRARVRYSDGTEVERTAIITFSDSEAPEAAVIEQLVSGLELPPEPLPELLSGELDGKP